ncbi:MAG: NlpC/P60 family protein [Actinomycetia bacterium]|nr:NlpC/P60 family protein [Actinomycetes bacterium]
MSRIFARRRLLAVGLTIALTSPLAASTATAAGGGFDSLRKGDSGPRVLLAQGVLDVDPRTGAFNDKTKRAVKRFQDHRSIAVTGVINARTYTALQKRWESIQAARARIDRKYHRIMKVARNQKGDPYRYGAAGPNAFDCSGLTMYVYKRATGKSLQHLAAAQFRAEERIGRKQARPGDLVFMHDNGDIYHVSIYAGHGKIIHAGRTGTNVQRDPIWSNSVYYARLLPNK